jgi:hypothetical protein
MRLIKYLLKETDSTLNNAVKALLMGILVTVVFLIAYGVLTKETEIAFLIFVFIVTTLGLFLRYNNKNK